MDVSPIIPALNEAACAAGFAAATGMDDSP
jgi:hypothetical protein